MVISLREDYKFLQPLKALSIKIRFFSTQKKVQNRWKSPNPKFLVQFHPAKHVRIWKLLFSQLLYTIRQLKSFGFIDKSQFLVSQLYLKFTPINQLVSWFQNLIFPALSSPSKTIFIGGWERGGFLERVPYGKIGWCSWNKYHQEENIICLVLNLPLFFIARVRDACSLLILSCFKTSIRN